MSIDLSRMILPRVSSTKFPWRGIENFSGKHDSRYPIELNYIYMFIVYIYVYMSYCELSVAYFFMLFLI